MPGNKPQPPRLERVTELGLTVLDGSTEGSGRGERLACEERAARVDHRGLATAPRTTSARAEARPVRGAHLIQSGEAARGTSPARGVPQRSIAGRLGGRCFGDSVRGERL